MYATNTATKKMETALDLNSSLAEELSAVRKKMERLRSDKEKTENMLKERNAMLHSQMKKIEERGKIQKQLEIEVDRLFRLKELKSYSMRISPLKSLREKKINEVQSLEIKDADWEDETPLQSSIPSHSSQAAREI